MNYSRVTGRPQNGAGCGERTQLVGSDDGDKMVVAGTVVRTGISPLSGRCSLEIRLRCYLCCPLVFAKSASASRCFTGVLTKYSAYGDILGEEA